MFRRRSEAKFDSRELLLPLDPDCESQNPLDISYWPQDLDPNSPLQPPSLAASDSTWSEALDMFPQRDRSFSSGSWPANAQSRPQFMSILDHDYSTSVQSTGQLDSNADQLLHWTGSGHDYAVQDMSPSLSYESQSSHVLTTIAEATAMPIASSALDIEPAVAHCLPYSSYQSLTLDPHGSFHTAYSLLENGPTCPLDESISNPENAFGQTICAGNNADMMRLTHRAAAPANVTNTRGSSFMPGTSGSGHTETTPGLLSTILDPVAEDFNRLVTSPTEHSISHGSMVFQNHNNDGVSQLPPLSSINEDSLLPTSLSSMSAVDERRRESTALQTEFNPLSLDANAAQSSAGRSAVSMDENKFRTDPKYSVEPDADGHYRCPFKPDEMCNHLPTKLKCNYDKYLDSHIKPFRCKFDKCFTQVFSSTACLLRHEREAHGLHGHGRCPYECLYMGCERRNEGRGFPRLYNQRDHMKRVHGWKEGMPEYGPLWEDAVVHKNRRRGGRGKFIRPKRDRKGRSRRSTIAAEESDNAGQASGEQTGSTKPTSHQAKERTPSLPDRAFTGFGAGWTQHQDFAEAVQRLPQAFYQRSQPGSWRA